MHIAIANDHGGFALKTFLGPHLKALGHQTTDCGCDSVEIVRYPLYAAKAMRMLAEKTADRVILVCSTGIGMSIFANKFRGARAALCTDSYMAKMTRLHNNSNVLCLGGKITGDNLALEICDVWLRTEFEGGRHNISLGIVADFEEEMLSAAQWMPRKEYP